MTNHINSENQIVLTTGMFDLLRLQIAKRKLNHQNEIRIAHELKKANQVLRRELPTGVVDIYKSVTVVDISTKEEQTYHFVPQNVARKKHATVSILSDLGIAFLGHNEGAKISWETENGEKTYLIKTIADYIRS